MNNIYLTGMMGSGKSVTGKRLAVLLKYRFADLDQCIEEKNQCTVAKIFESKGEPFFRDEETAVLGDMCRTPSMVIATGGGIVLRPQNVRMMQESGKIVYLKTSLDVLWARLRDKKDRPLLLTSDPRASLQKIYEVRKALYEQSAALHMDTDGKTAEDVAREIHEVLTRENK